MDACCCPDLKCMPDPAASDDTMRTCQVPPVEPEGVPDSRIAVAAAMSWSKS